jgi:hypothetical protein
MYTTSYVDFYVSRDRRILRYKIMNSAGLRVGRSGVRVPAGLGIFLFTTAFRPALGPTQPPIERVPEALFLGVKRPGSETDRSPSLSAEVK